jgi:hypothetical protein
MVSAKRMIDLQAIDHLDEYVVIADSSTFFASLILGRRRECRETADKLRVRQ